MSDFLVRFWIAFCIGMAIFGIVRYVQVSSECDGVVVKAVEFGDGLACIEGDG